MALTPEQERAVSVALADSFNADQKKNLVVALGNASGSASFAGLTDVNISDPENGQLVRFASGELTNVDAATVVQPQAVVAVAGLPGATDGAFLTFLAGAPMWTQGAAQADSVAATLPALVADFNALLAKLRAAGILDT